MGIIELIIVLVIGVTVSNIISHFIPFIPISLFQISIGLALALVAGVDIKVDSHWFMLLFVAPLLFNDAWRFPKRELWELRGPILGNAILLVLITTLVGGFLIHIVVPQLPISVALALAAVISPTDPVAVQAIAKRVKLPENVMHVVTGESLVNDATGLVSFNTAVKATVVGSFMIGEALINFAWMTIAGVIVGGLLGALIVWVRDSIARFGLNDIVFYTVITLLIPFIVYWDAEVPVHSSGLIAVVTAGIVAKLLNDRHQGLQSPEASIMSVHIWEVWVYLLNGLIFVLLGIILPSATHNIFESNQIHNFTAIYYGFMVWLIIFSLRSLWAYGIQWGHYWRHHKGVPSFRTAIISGLTGVRGAVTMAAVLTIPTMTASGQVFPGRDLVIFLAAMVVILSLLVASIMLPIVTKQKTRHDFTQPEMDVEIDGDDDPTDKKTKQLDEVQARIWIVRIGIQQLRDSQNDENRRIIFELVTRRQKTIRQLRQEIGDDSNQYDLISEQEQELLDSAVQAERDALQQLLVTEKISPMTYSIQARHLDQVADSLESHHRYRAQRGLKPLLHKARVAIHIWLSGQSSDKVREESDLVVREMSKAAIKCLSDLASEQVGDTVSQRIYRQSAYNLIVVYRYQIEQAKHSDSISQRDLDDRWRLELELKALNAERDMTQQLYEQGRINRQTSINLRQFINYAETKALVGRNEE
ncbi:cation:proton antiporter [Convivina praedatoris]|uniref:Sodium, potassium, lithium and rubidium/H(+) antiporter n=1 Tax=Convivina praedatoris TaxID=2880963 RepID=A0ABN8H9R0_9LACO|nr:sodium:proton antiporter [Convivina sp. LMG 32447]CAH1850279.1 Sodium, potassium, lithium and rubidium/H(+) antiporter [Convivina sp. LMG 32447]CAH1850288.1 Sodium, potassium, lithium and rubidium/H(+) antiporter [Convivina sp. LMG 32447]CAH1850924.1 Sodium, potassium, lithium and rubidium/H(+) antiporter [Convivina sp. LMG 32447]